MESSGNVQYSDPDRPVSLAHPKHYSLTLTHSQGFPGGTRGEEPPASAGDIRDSGSFPGQEDPLQEGMATHPSILAWRIPWTEEPGRLESMGSRRVGHN